MIIEGINVLAVCAAALMSLALGVLWYSPQLFGNPWARIVGVNVEEEAMKSVERGVRFLCGFLTHLLFYIAVAVVVSSVPTTRTLWVVVAALSVIALLNTVSAVIWERKSLLHAAITIGYALLILWVGSGIIMFWPW